MSIPAITNSGLVDRLLELRPDEALPKRSACHRRTGAGRSTADFPGHPRLPQRAPGSARQPAVTLRLAGLGACVKPGQAHGPGQAARNAAPAGTHRLPAKSLEYPNSRIQAPNLPWNLERMGGLEPGFKETFEVLAKTRSLTCRSACPGDRAWPWIISSDSSCFDSVAVPTRLQHAIGADRLIRRRDNVQFDLAVQRREWL